MKKNGDSQPERKKEITAGYRPPQPPRPPPSASPDSKKKGK
jgi:hypothetical protein